MFFVNVESQCVHICVLMGQIVLGDGSMHDSARSIFPFILSLIFEAVDAFLLGAVQK